MRWASPAPTPGSRASAAASAWLTSPRGSRRAAHRRAAVGHERRAVLAIEALEPHRRIREPRTPLAHAQPDQQSEGQEDQQPELGAGVEHARTVARGRGDPLECEFGYPGVYPGGFALDGYSIYSLSVARGVVEDAAQGVQIGLEPIGPDGRVVETAGSPHRLELGRSSAAGRVSGAPRSC